MESFDINNEFMIMLEKLRYNYGLYIGEKSLTKLNDFMCGYLIALYEIQGKEDVKFFHRIMREIVTTKYNDTTGNSWTKVLCYYHKTEANAFDRFYELLDEYKTDLRKT